MIAQEKRISLHLCRMDSKYRQALKAMVLHRFSGETIKRDANAFCNLVRAMPVKRISTEPVKWNIATTNT